MRTNRATQNCNGLVYEKDTDQFVLYIYISRVSKMLELIFTYMGQNKTLKRPTNIITLLMVNVKDRDVDQPDEYEPQIVCLSTTWHYMDQIIRCANLQVALCPLNLYCRACYHPNKLHIEHMDSSCMVYYVNILWSEWNWYELDVFLGQVLIADPTPHD